MFVECLFPEGSCKMLVLRYCKKYGTEFEGGNEIVFPCMENAIVNVFDVGSATDGRAHIKIEDMKSIMLTL